MATRKNPVEKELRELMKRYSCSRECAIDVTYLRSRDDYTPELEAQLVADRKAGVDISILDWPNPDDESLVRRIRIIIASFSSTGHRSLADRLARLIEPLIKTPEVLTVGDRVRYVGDDISHMGEHFITEAHFQADGTVEYVTERGAWYNRSDFELLERSDPRTLAQIPRLMNRRESDRDD